MGRRFVKLAVGLMVSLLFVIGMVGVAKADTPIPANEFFTHNPITYAPQWQYDYPYGRNIFWNFSVSPFGAGATDAEYFGLVDGTLKASDLVTDGKDRWGNSLYSNSAHNLRVSGQYGTYNTGTATFKINNIPGNLNSTQYLWVEFDTIISGSGSYVSPVLTYSGGNLVDSWKSWTGNITASSTAGNPYNMWFKFDTFPTYETLAFTLYASNASGSQARIDNLHFVATPEPVSTALFLLGGTVLVVRRIRRNKK